MDPIAIEPIAIEGRFSCTVMAIARCLTEPEVYYKICYLLTLIIV